MSKSVSSAKLSPWLAGILLAFLFVVSLYVLDASVGDITAYNSLANKIVEIYKGTMPSFNWEELFLIGVLAGAIIAALSGDQFKIQLVPEDQLTKGPAYYLTTGLVTNFLGGFLVMSGMIIAGGSFFKMWEDALGLFTIVGLFLIIMFIEAVVIGTILTLRIEEK